MPWPFDKYKMPAAAKKWLSKYPNSTNDNFEEEFVYLDEIEDRISDHFKKQRQSPKFREAQNEFGLIGKNRFNFPQKKSKGKKLEKHSSGLFPQKSRSFTNMKVKEECLNSGPFFVRPG